MFIFVFIGTVLVAPTAMANYIDAGEFESIFLAKSLHCIRNIEGINESVGI